MGPDGPEGTGWDAAHFHSVSWWRNMNRTRKVAVAGLAIAVAVVLIAMVLVNPTLHTQTPVSVTPPANGGAGSGGSSATGTGNGTSTNCTVAGGNETGENGDQEGSTASTCGDLTADHDSMGDRMSSEHRSLEATEHIHSGLEEDAIALVRLGMTAAAPVVHDLFSLAFL